MKRTRKLILALVVVMSLLMAMAVAVIPASAATTKTIYLKPNGWESDSAVLEAWIWGGGDQWVTFNDTDADGVFEATVPSGTTGFKLLRRSPSHTKGSWDSNTYWNQTGDISLGGKNCVKLTNWSGGYSTENFTPTPSDPVVAVAGSMNGWSTDANKVTSKNGVATITISNIAKGEKTFKIVVNGSWVGYTSINIDSSSNISMSDKGGNDHNIMFNTEGAGAATFTYTIATKTIKVVWTCNSHIHTNNCDTDCNDCGETRVITHDYADATCTAPKTCRTCGATEGEALGHDWDDATCTAPKTCGTCGATEGEALGHDWDDATCTAPKTCATCGATEGEALGHKWDDNCDTECNVCGDERVAPHNWSSECDELCGDCEATREAPKEHGELDEYVFNATCEEDGYIDYICHDCGDIINTVTLPANHDHDACPHKAVVGDTYYETLQQAIAGAAAGREIVLNSDIEVVGDLTIENQVTINLNGKTLTAGAVVTFFEGTQFIGEGKLVVAKDSLYNIKGETDYVPVWNEAGYYTFSEVKDQIKESTVEDTEVVVFRPAFENKDIKKEFADGATDNGISFVISITWGTDENAVSKEYTLSEELIANVYNAENPKAIQLGFENWQAGVEYTVTLRIVSGGIYYETTLCTMKDGVITVPEIVTE